MANMSRNFHQFCAGKEEGMIQSSRNIFFKAYQSFASGLYCEAVITTWKAMLHDIKRKTFNLEEEGEGGQAKILADRIREAERNKDKRQHQRIEDDLLEFALKMGLTDESQKKDLERIKEARNLCAHDTEFEPPEWQVKGHLKDALEHLLSQPARVGKRAVDRLLDDMGMKSFPDEEHKIWEYVGEKYFKQARGVFFTNLLKALLRAPFGESRREQFKSLEARKKLGIVLDELKRGHPNVFEEDCGPFLERYLDKVADKDLLMLSPFFVKTPELWDKMGVPNQIRFKVGVKKL